MAVFKAAAKPPKTEGGLRNLVKYVLRDEKTDETLVDGVGDFHDFAYGYQYDPDRVLQEYARVRDEYGKNSGRLAAHYIVSFPPGEVSAVQAHDVGIALAEKLWPEHQVLVVTHIDKEHIHNHFIINSTAYTDGHKLHTKKQDLKTMKSICDELCASNGLSMMQKGYHADGTPMASGDVTTGNRNLWKLLESGRKSYIAECAVCVQTAVRQSRNRTEFIRNMENYGWQVNWTDRRSHITFVDQEGHRVRDSKISRTFHLHVSKEELTHEFERNAADIEADYHARRERASALEAARREREITEAERERRKVDARRREAARRK